MYMHDLFSCALSNMRREKKNRTSPSLSSEEEDQVLVRGTEAGQRREGRNQEGGQKKNIGRQNLDDKHDDDHHQDHGYDDDDHRRHAREGGNAAAADSNADAGLEDGVLDVLECIQRQKHNGQECKFIVVTGEPRSVLGDEGGWVRSVAGGGEGDWEGQLAWRRGHRVHV